MVSPSYPRGQPGQYHINDIVQIIGQGQSLSFKPVLRAALQAAGPPGAAAMGLAGGSPGGSSLELAHRWALAQVRTREKGIYPGN